MTSRDLFLTIQKVTDPAREKDEIGREGAEPID
jgi:hypothetical protein